MSEMIVSSSGCTQAVLLRALNRNLNVLVLTNLKAMFMNVLLSVVTEIFEPSSFTSLPEKLFTLE